jgi:hypothetical protein
MSTPSNVNRSPVNTTSASFERMAEVNAEFEPAAKELPKQASPAPQDGVDRQGRAVGPGVYAGNTSGEPEVKAPAKASEGGTKDDTAKLMSEVQKRTPVELMKMLREGTIPANIAENPQAMNLMLARIQEFSRMVQMVTNMMQVEHETLTAIIRNIKA